MFSKIIDWVSIVFVVGIFTSMLYYIISSIIEVPEARILVGIVFGTATGMYLFFNGIEQLIRLSNKKG